MDAPKETWIFYGGDYTGTNGRKALEQFVKNFSEGAKEVTKDKEGRTVIIQADGEKIVIVSPPLSIIEQAKKVPPGANVIVACHGSKDGYLGWDLQSENGGREWEFVSYDDFFRALGRPNPKDNPSFISIVSCYGGQSLDDFNTQYVPVGAVLQSFVGDTPTEDAPDKLYRNVATLDPIDMIIDALGVHIDADRRNPKKNDSKASIGTNLLGVGHGRGAAHPVDIDKLLPDIICIGGNPAVPVRLADEVRNMKKQDGRLDQEAFTDATERVVDRFCVFAREKPVEKNTISMGATQTKEEMAAAIKYVAARMLDPDTPMPPGMKLSEFEIKRIEYALAVAYLDESGDLDRRIAKAKGGEPTYQTAALEAGKANPAKGTMQDVDGPNAQSVGTRTSAAAGIAQA